MRFDLGRPAVTTIILAQPLSREEGDIYPIACTNNPIPGYSKDHTPRFEYRDVA